MQLRVVWPPHCDYLRVSGPGIAASDAGFVPSQGRWWRPGWTAKEEARSEAQGGGIRTNADAEKHTFFWPQGWGDGPFPNVGHGFHVTRVDVACDVVFVDDAGRNYRPGAAPGFTLEHRLLFTGRGRRKTEETKHECTYLRLGSQESPVTLKIYRKTSAKNLDDRTREMWRRHGWNGQSDVWRIEYTFGAKALPRDVHIPRDVDALWADGLARIRMCAVPPRTCSQQNKAPTHPWWVALGRPRRLSRTRSDLPVVASEMTVRRAVEALDRLCVRSGVEVLPALLLRLQRHLKR